MSETGSSGSLSNERKKSTADKHSMNKAQDKTVRSANRKSQRTGNRAQSGKAGEIIARYGTPAKYLFSLLLVAVSCLIAHDFGYLLIGLGELCAIALLSNELVLKYRKLGIVVNDILMLIFNIQYVVLMFGGSFVSMIMLDNLGSLDMLRGKAFQYAAGAVLVLLFSLVPHRGIRYRGFPVYPVLTGVFAFLFAFTTILGNGFAPYYNLVKTVAEKIESDTAAKAAYADIDVEDYWRDYIEAGRDKPASLPEKPNVVIIFAEGVSDRIIQDERNITPYLRGLQDQAISFENYYNHTAATYRGLIGTLFSGYQIKNLDQNKLISIQSILRDQGYSTAFLNVEPENASFTKYLEDMGFDQVLSREDSESDSELLYDKEAYDLMYSHMEKENASGKPFLACMYTIGSHVSFQSQDVVYGDGNSDILNRFYQMDYHFGEFLERVKNSEMGENTIVVFTTDHCTYADADYLEEFDDSDRLPFVDKIPFMIYYPGVEAQKIDAGGRNSLDMAPTLFDLMDISVPNYFLGGTLFYPVGEIDNNYDKINCIGTTMVTTMGGKIDQLGENQAEIVREKILNYSVLATHGVK